MRNVKLRKISGISAVVTYFKKVAMNTVFKVYIIHNSKIHSFRHLLLPPLINDPPSVATSIAPWTTPDQLAIAPWSTARTIYHSFFAPWSIAWSTHRSSYRSLVHRLHHPSLLPLLHDPSLATLIAPSILPDPPHAPSIAPSIAPWSTARTYHRSFHCSPIHRLQHSWILLFSLIHRLHQPSLYL